MVQPSGDPSLVCEHSHELDAVGVADSLDGNFAGKGALTGSEDIREASAADHGPERETAVGLVGRASPSPIGVFGSTGLHASNVRELVGVVGGSP